MTTTENLSGKDYAVLNEISRKENIQHIRVVLRDIMDGDGCNMVEALGSLIILASKIVDNTLLEGE